MLSLDCPVFWGRPFCTKRLSGMRLNNIKVTIVSLKKKLYPLCSVLVGSRNRFKLDFVNRMASITIDLKQIIIDQTKNFRFFFEILIL